MMRIGTFLLLFGLCQGLAAQQANVFIRPKPKGHTGMITSMVATRDGRFLYTAGLDARILKWDLQYHTIVQEYYPPYGPPPMGQVFSMSLSHDERYLLVKCPLMGYDSETLTNALVTGQNQEGADINSFQLYDVQTGRMAKVYTANAKVGNIAMVKFGKRSKHFFALSDRAIDVFEQVDTTFAYRITYNVNEYIAGVEQVADTMYTLNTDGLLRYKVGHIPGQHVQLLQVPTGKDNYWVRLVASQDGRWLAALSNTNELVIISTQGRVVYRQQLSFASMGASFSHDGNWLVLSKNDYKPAKVPLLQFTANGWQESATYAEYPNFPVAQVFGAWHDYFSNWNDIGYVRHNALPDAKDTDRRPVWLGTLYADAPVYRGSAITPDGKLVFQNMQIGKGFAQRYNSFDIRARKLAVLDDVGALPLRNLTAWQGGAASAKSHFVMITNRGTSKDTIFTLGIFAPGPDLGRATEGSKLLQTIQAGRVKSHDIAPPYWGPRGLYLTEEKGLMHIVPTSGVGRYQLNGHAGKIDNLVVTPDSQFVISTGQDRLTHFWRVSEIQPFRYDTDLGFNFYEYIQAARTNKLMAENVLQAIQSVIDAGRKIPSVDSLFQTQIAKNWVDAFPTVFRQFKMRETEIDSLIPLFHASMKKGVEGGFAYTPRIIKPYASLFFNDSGTEWVLWLRDGYYTATPGGAQYIGFHVNNGNRREASFYPFEQFDLKNNRPDIVFERLGIRDANTIALFRQAYEKRVKRMGLRPEALRADLALPQVRLRTASGITHTRLNHLQFTVTDAQHVIDRINVYVNDVPILGTQGLRTAQLQQKQLVIGGADAVQGLAGITAQGLPVQLLSGRNKVQVSVLNAAGIESLRETIYLTYEVRDADYDSTQHRANLYILAIGVSAYKDSQYNLTYASKDARDIASRFAKMPFDSTGSRLFRQIQTKIIADAQVTREAILAARQWLQQARAQDIVIVFVAGHGMLDANFDYYYGTHDIDFNNPAGRGIKYEELDGLLDGLPALRKLLLMDTCHSGEVDKDEVRTTTEAVVQNSNTSTVKFRAAGRGVRQKNAKGTQAVNQLVTELFANLKRGTGSTVISSAGGGEFAWESAEWANGLFTYCLLRGLTQKTADLDGDGGVSASELQQYVMQQVATLSGGQQNPTARIGVLERDYLLWR